MLTWHLIEVLVVGAGDIAVAKFENALNVRKVAFVHLARELLPQVPHLSWLVAQGHNVGLCVEGDAEDRALEEELV